MAELVLMRHGESQWNKENRFTGWSDVDLSARGRLQAWQAGMLLKVHGYRFDVAFTSTLKRAIRTLWTVLDALDLMWIPVECTWRLNERHYGVLQGLNKAQTAMRHGSAQVQRWRRSLDARPPPLDRADPRAPGHDPRYRHLDSRQLPLTESLSDASHRLLPYWRMVIAPMIRADLRVLIVAHSNSLRALVMELEHSSGADISTLSLRTAAPLVYRLDDHLRPVEHRYLTLDREADALVPLRVLSQA